MALKVDWRGKRDLEREEVQTRLFFILPAITCTSMNFTAVFVHLTGIDTGFKNCKFARTQRASSHSLVRSLCELLEIQGGET